MHEDLKQCFQRLGEEFPCLNEAADFTHEAVEQARSFLPMEVPPTAPDLDVVLLGSFARGEASGQSDFDYLIIAHRLPESLTQTKDLLKAINTLRKMLDLKEPGLSGIFGGVISAPDLTERIGLDQDTNLTHSRRILLLEESVSVYQPELHRKLIEAILDRYLMDYTDPKGVPRFLLNDVIRYWRTLAVDYQAKHWQRYHLDQPEWGLRYLKLIISRKIAFAATLASLFLVDGATSSYLADEFSHPPLVRLGRLMDVLEDELKSPLREVFSIAEEFAAALKDRDFRAEVKVIASKADVKPGSRFDQLRDRARTLQKHLEAIFFDSEALKSKSRKYLSF